MEYPLEQYAIKRPQKTDQETTVASKYHQYGLVDSSRHGSLLIIPWKGRTLLVSTPSILNVLMEVNKAIVVIMNRYIFIREYFTNKSYFTDNAANKTNVTIAAIIEESRIISLSIFKGNNIVVAAIGIEVERPTTIDNELRITLVRFLNEARL